jgi:hypothetical protein
MTTAIDGTAARHLACTAAEYHARDEWNRSKLWMLHNDGAPLFHGTHITGEFPPKRTNPMDVGTIAHASLLDEGGPITVCRVVPPHALNRQGHRKGKNWEAFRDTWGSRRILLKPEEYEPIKRMVANVQADPVARGWLDDIEHREHTIISVDAETELRLRTRPDMICRDGDGVAIVDFKTTHATTVEAFKSHGAKLGYHFQAAWYWEAAEALGFDVRRFLFIAVDKSPAHECRVFEISERLDDSWEALRIGRELVRQTRRDLRRRLDADDWRSDTHGNTLSFGLPGWAIPPVELSVSGMTLTL